MAERLGNRAINQKDAGLIPGRAKWCCVLGQDTSPYLPQVECPCTYCKSLWITASAKWRCVWCSGASGPAGCPDLVLLAGAEQEVVVRHLPASWQQHVIGRSVDPRHLAGHHVDPGAERKLGVVALTVAVAVGEFRQQCEANGPAVGTLHFLEPVLEWVHWTSSLCVYVFISGNNTSILIQKHILPCVCIQYVSVCLIILIIEVTENTVMVDLDGGVHAT